MKGKHTSAEDIADTAANGEKPQEKHEKQNTRKCMVYLLNRQEFEINVPRNANGSDLLNQVRELLDIIEFDYFGLYFEDSAQHRYWLESAKSMKKQLKNSPWKFHFAVKFYPSDPSQLTEDIARYYMVLQLKENIVSGMLPCSFVTHALLGSFVVQSELGDYDVTSMRGNYVAGFQFAPNQTTELEERVMELHKTHSGLTPVEAEIAFLENVKKLPLYGVDQHAVKDSENVDLMLGVSWNGLRVYRDQVQINRFAWPRILKISYARSKYFIRIRPVDDQVEESVVGFKLPNHRAAKKLWKSSVEHHTFFRLTKPDTPKAKLIRTGSTFRYSGYTQHQTRQMVAQTTRKTVPKIQRTASRRSYSSSTCEKSKGRISQSTDDRSPPALPKKEHAVERTTTEVVTITEEIVSEEANKPKPTTETVEKVTTTTWETVEVQLQQTEAPKAASKSRTSSSSSSYSSFSDDGTDRLTKHQKKIHRMKRKFLQEPPPDSRGSSEWDLKLHSSPAKNTTSEPSQNQNQNNITQEVTTEVTTTVQQQAPVPLPRTSTSKEEVTVVTVVTEEVVETHEVVQAPKERKESTSSSSSSESEKEEEKEEVVVEVKEEIKETKEVPLPDFVPVQEPEESPASSSSSSSSSEEEKEEEEPEEIVTVQHEDIIHEPAVIHTEYTVVETVIRNQYADERAEHQEPEDVEEAQPEVEEEEPQPEEEKSEEEEEEKAIPVPVVTSKRSSTSSSSDSSSSSSSDEEFEEAPQEVVEEQKPEPEEEEPSTEEVEEMVEEKTEVVVLERTVSAQDEPVTLQSHVITTVETKSVRVEDVVIPQADNEVRRVALTADQDNNVTETVSRSSSSSSSSSSSGESDEEEDIQEEDAPVVNGFKKPPIVETEVVYVEPTEEEKPEVTTEPPLVQTETKTITYESNSFQHDAPEQPAEGDGNVQLLSSQTITAETMSSVTTTHITKTVVGTVSETRVEKSFVITADGDANLHQAMAEAIKDAQENNPDANITRVVVHEEKVIEHN